MTTSTSHGNMADASLSAMQSSNPNLLFHLFNIVSWLILFMSLTRQMTNYPTVSRSTSKLVKMKLPGLSLVMNSFKNLSALKKSIAPICLLYAQLITNYALRVVELQFLTFTHSPQVYHQNFITKKKAQLVPNIVNKPIQTVAEAKKISAGPTITPK